MPEINGGIPEGFKQTEIGMIPEDWEVIELKEALKEKGYIRGPFGSSLRRPELKSEGIPVYEQANAIENHRKFRFFIDEEKYKELKRFTVEEDDLVLSCSGTFGKVTIIKKEDPKGIISQALLILRPDTKKINPNYLKYFLRSTVGYNAIASRSLGSVQINIGKREVIEKIQFSIPQNRDEQDYIVKILSDLDSKIELNQQMNKTLEASGQAIFKHWFIDFEFPNEEGKPYKSSGGEMVYNEELGKKVPKGWEVKRLKDIVLKLGPGTNFQPERISTGIPFLNIKNISNGFLDLTNVKYISNEDFERVHKSWKPEEHDVLISRIGTLGNVAIIRKKDLPLSVHYNIIDVKPKDTSHAFLYFLFTSDFFQNEYHLRKVQTVQEYVTIENVKEIKIAIPKKDDLKILDTFFINLMNKMEANSIEIQTLSAIRDSLLPKLMSGKIRVPVEVGP